MQKPLEGLRVVDTTNNRGELCGRLLADLGASVVLVEPCLLYTSDAADE